MTAASTADLLQAICGLEFHPMSQRLPAGAYTGVFMRTGSEIIVQGWFTRGFNEQQVKDSKRDHSGEELFTNQLLLLPAVLWSSKSIFSLLFLKYTFKLKKN